MKLLEAPQYSIWWMPEGELLTKLQMLINTLGQEFKANQYGAESFAPHITVIPEIKTNNLEALVSNLEQFVCTLDGAVRFELAEIDKGKTFYQCCFAKAEVNDLMLKTINQARERFRPEIVNTLFMPHLSLLYGDFPEDVRSKAVKRAKELIKLPQTFLGNKISLWTSGESAKDWQKVEEFEVRMR